MTDEAKLKAARDAAALAMDHANSAEIEAGKARDHAAASAIAADAAREAAADAVDLLDEVLGSEGGEPEPDDDLIFQHEIPLTEPLQYDAGEWAGLKTFLAIVEFANDPTGHEKIAGADSIKADQGGFCIGRQPSGNLEAWVMAGSTFTQVKLPINARQATVVALHIREDQLELAVGDHETRRAFNPPVVDFNGPAVLAAGYWAHNQVHPMVGTILACAGWRSIDEPRNAAWLEAHKHLIEAAPPVEPPVEPPIEPPIEPPTGAGLEPVNPSLHQVAIKVDAKPRQEWHGFGFGLNNWSEAEKVFPQVQQSVRKLCEDLDTNIMRIFTPESPAGCLKAYRPYWNLFREHGVDTIFASCFLYRSTAANATDEILCAQARKIAQGIKDCNAGGLNAEDWFVALQNEPEGNPANGVKGNYVSHHTAFLDEIKRLGLADKVHLVGLEWRHGPNRMPAEYDAYGTALLGQGKIEWGCHHIYDKGSDDAMYDARWMKQRGIWSTELGNNSDSASSAGRMIAGMNHGSVAEIVHYCQVTTPNPSGEQLGQALLDFRGIPRPWYGALQTISTTFARGDTFRLCTSSDRPEALATKIAQRMIRNAATSGGRNPRQEVTVAIRNGKAVLAAVNTTHGKDAFSPYTSGHYGALAQQLTVTIPELAGKNGRFFAKRAKHGGGMENGQPVSFANGVLRFSLAPGETVGLTQE